MGKEGRGRKERKGEQEQGKTSQQLVLPTPDGYNEGAPASVMELDLTRMGVLMVSFWCSKWSKKTSVQLATSRAVPDGGGCKFMNLVNGAWKKEPLGTEKKWRNSQGKDPRTFEGNRQGAVPGTPGRNSQGKDPSTFK